MKTRILAAIVPAVMVFISAQAMAQVQTFQLQGTVDFFRTEGTGGPVLSVGAPVSGTFYYDPSLPAASEFYGNAHNGYVQQDVYDLPNSAGIDLNVGGHLLHADGLKVTVIKFSPTEAPVALLQGVKGSTSVDHQVDLNASINLTLPLLTGNPGALSEYALPVQFSSAAPDPARGLGNSIGGGGAAGDPVTWFATLKLTNISAVPETSSWATFGLGLGLMAAVALRRRPRIGGDPISRELQALA